MRNVVWGLVVGFGMIFSLPGVAAASAIFTFDSMMCEGIRFGRPGMADRERVLVSLEMRGGEMWAKAQYFSLDAEAARLTAPSEEWALGSLYTDGRDVFRRSFSGRGDGLHLKRTDAHRLEGAWIFKREGDTGKWPDTHDVYGYHLRCELGAIRP